MGFTLRCWINVIYQNISILVIIFYYNLNAALCCIKALSALYYKVQITYTKESGTYTSCNAKSPLIVAFISLLLNTHSVQRTVTTADSQYAFLIAYNSSATVFLHPLSCDVVSPCLMQHLMQQLRLINIVFYGSSFAMSQRFGPHNISSSALFAPSLMQHRRVSCNRCHISSVAHFTTPQQFFQRHSKTVQNTSFQTFEGLVSCAGKGKCVTDVVLRFIEVAEQLLNINKNFWQ